MRVRPEVEGVTESPLLAIGTLAERMPGSIKLCYGEPDAPTPAFITRAAHDAAVTGHTFYTHTAGYPELREAIAAKVGALHGVPIRASEVMSTVGATMAVFAALRTVLGPGDNAVVISPAYSLFTNGAIIAGAEPRQVPLARAGDRFVLDLDRVRDAIDRNTRAIVVNSPNNPTGWVIAEDEQAALLALADAHDLAIIADEVYERIVYDGPIAASFARAAARMGLLDRLIVANSFSKTYNMTGWRLGWAQASEAMTRRMYSAVEFMTSNATAPVQQAGIVALRDGEPFVAELKRTYAARRALVIRSLAAMPGLTVSAPAGAFYAFARVDGVDDSAAFAERLLRATGVALTPGSAFGAGGEGHVRLCFASSEAVLTEALGRLEPGMRAARA